MYHIVPTLVTDMESHKSFDLVEMKLEEAKFFLQCLKKAGKNTIHVGWYFNALVSAGRSVTFALQFTMSEIKGFPEWYASQEAAMSQSSLMRLFVKMRNYSQKRGDMFVRGGRFTRNPKTGEGKLEYFITDASGKAMFQEDVETACMSYIAALQALVSDCRERFGEEIDPDKCFTAAYLSSHGLSIEDLEERLGFPRGWTSMIPDEERLRLLRESTPPIMAMNAFKSYIA